MYVYERTYRSDTWKQVAKLVAPNGVAFDIFGTSVAMQDNRIAVGAPGQNGLKPEGAPAPATDAGRVYVYEKGSTGWELKDQLVIDDPGPADALGTSVPFDRGSLIVGAPGRDTIVPRNNQRPTLISNTGAAFEFRRQGGKWVKTTDFLPEERREGELFGVSISVDARRILVGSAHETEEGPQDGIAQLWKRGDDENQWTYVARLRGPSTSGLSNWGLGYACALKGGLAVLGAPQAVSPGVDENEVGAVAVYKVPTPTPAPLMPLWMQLLGSLSFAGMAASALGDRYGSLRHRE